MSYRYGIEKKLYAFKCFLEGWTVAQWILCVVCRHEDLHFGQQDPHKEKLGMAVSTRNSSILGTEAGGSRAEGHS